MLVSKFGRMGIKKVEMIKRYFIYCINIKIPQSINMNILKLKSLISEYYKLIVD